MTKKITPKIFIVLFFLTACSLLHGLETTLEVRAGAFYPTSKHFRKNYDDVGAFYELEASISCNPCYAFWANIDWFPKKGKAFGHTCHSINCHSGHPSTRVDIGNFSLGIKFPYELCPCLIGYLGIGPSFGCIWIKNHSHHHHKDKHHHENKISKAAVGLVLKSGINYYVSQCAFIDIFVDYLYQPVHFKHRIDIGGVKVGGGLGFRF